MTPTLGSVLSVGIGLLFLLASPVFCQTPASWSRVEQLRAGTTVTCILHDHSQVAGRLQSASIGGIIAKAPRGSVVQLDRNSIATVVARQRPRGAKWTWIGFGMGVGVGAGVAIAGGTARDPAGWAAIGALSIGMFGAAGVGIGHLARGRPEDRIVYRAPDRPGEPGGVR